MQRHVPKAAFRAAAVDTRRARTLAVSLAVLLAGTAVYVQNAQAAECGAQSDFLVVSDPLPAPVRPADCAHLFQASPDFAWPAISGAAPWTVTVTFPDGTTQSRTTNTNWLAWDAALPAGRYSWRVSRGGVASQPRSFTVDAAAEASASASRDSLGFPTLAVAAGAPSAHRENAIAPRDAQAATAWTSTGAFATWPAGR